MPFLLTPLSFPATPDNKCPFSISSAPDTVCAHGSNVQNIAAQPVQNMLEISLKLMGWNVFLLCSFNYMVNYCSMFYLFYTMSQLFWNQSCIIFTWVTDQSASSPTSNAAHPRGKHLGLLSALLMLSQKNWRKQFQIVSALWNKAFSHSGLFIIVELWQCKICTSFHRTFHYSHYARKSIVTTRKMTGSKLLCAAGWFLPLPLSPAC